MTFSADTICTKEKICQRDRPCIPTAHPSVAKAAKELGQHLFVAPEGSSKAGPGSQAMWQD